MLHRCGWMVAGVGVAAMLLAGCGPGTGNKDSASKTIIRVTGSDTMVNVARAWAGVYHKARPDVSVQVGGGGSGVGIASLIDGTCDMANTSRRMTEKEIERAKAKRGVEPIEHIVGYDSLAIYVHKDNPLESISLEELAEIYGKGGKLEKWSDLGVTIPGVANDEITRVSRQNSSGTYAYFREAVLGEKRDYRLGSIDQSGSKDVVVLVSRTRTAIGYSGMGYQAEAPVKVLKVSRKKGAPGVPPTVENTTNGTYPLTRPLQIYTAGAPAGAVKEYLAWILADDGQKALLEQGYVSVSKSK